MKQHSNGQLYPEHKDILELYLAQTQDEATGISLEELADIIISALGATTANALTAIIDNKCDALFASE